jgi:uncharacterized protein
MSNGKENLNGMCSFDIAYNNLHQYELSEQEICSIFSKKIYQDIIATKAFQRLKNIHFLGSIDYTLPSNGARPNRRYTRYQHSLCVAHLALEFSNQCSDLTESQRNLCVISALLHDIGHAPLSHTLESVFVENTGISHHESGIRIIRGDVDIGKDLFETLQKWKIEPFDITCIISGKWKSPINDIFAHAINIDTIEAILRGSTYLYKKDMFFTARDVLYALITVINRDSVIDDKSVNILDNFWRLKGEVYSWLIQGDKGIIADYLCQDYMRKNILFNENSHTYYYGTEKELYRNHSKLFSELRKIGKKYYTDLIPNNTSIPCALRKFSINKDIPLVDVKSIRNRYVQQKYLCSKTFKQNNIDNGLKRFQEDSVSLSLF